MAFYASQIPNILSFLRLILLFPIVHFLTSDEVDYFLISFILFLIGVFTDYADGYLARKMKRSSKLGAFIDPLFDKVFILSLFLVFYFRSEIFFPILFFIIFLVREYFVTMMRIELLISSKNDSSKTKSSSSTEKKEFKTSFIGKLKLSIQALVLLYFYSISFLYLQYDIDPHSNIIKALTIPLLLFTSYLLLASGYDYIKKYKDASYRVYVKSIASVFYIGHFKYFSGGVTALITTSVIYLIDYSILIHSIVTVLSIVLGIYFCFLLEKIVPTKDPRIATIDEFAGVCIAMIPAFFVDEGYRLIFFVLSYVIFGVLDKLKPGIINKTQELKGGWGVVIDDVFAGVFTAGILFLLLFIISL